MINFLDGFLCLLPVITVSLNISLLISSSTITQNYRKEITYYVVNTTIFFYITMVEILLWETKNLVQNLATTWLMATRFGNWYTIENTHLINVARCGRKDSDIFGNWSYAKVDRDISNIASNNLTWGKRNKVASHGIVDKTWLAQNWEIIKMEANQN